MDMIIFSMNADGLDDDMVYNDLHIDHQLSLFDDHDDKRELNDNTPIYHGISGNVNVINTFREHIKQCEEIDTGNYTGDEASQSLEIINQAQSSPTISSTLCKENENKSTPKSSKLDVQYKHSVRKIVATPKQKSKQNLTKRKRKRRLTPKPCSKTRKDVAMKRILRRCRKYYSDLYLNFAAKFDKKHKSKHTLLLDKRILAKFVAKMFKGHSKQNDLAFYLASIIFPYELVSNVSEFVEESPKFLSSAENIYAKPKNGNDEEYYKEIVDRVHDVLYKFSYQKLQMFCKIPELSTLYQYYFKQLCKDSTDSYSIAEEIKHYCI